VRFATSVSVIPRASDARVTRFFAGLPPRFFFDPLFFAALFFPLFLAACLGIASPAVSVDGNAKHSNRKRNYRESRERLSIAGFTKSFS
jgi:hypothetical protein